MRLKRLFSVCAMSIAAATLSGVPVGASPALASAPAWSISSLARPSSFAVGDAGDEYELTITNVGSASTSASEPVVISDRLPLGVRVVNVILKNLETGAESACPPSGSPLRCVYGVSVQAGDTLAVKVQVEVTPGAGSGPILNSATVTGGGTPTVSTSEPLTMPTAIGAVVEPFGIEALEMEARDERGVPDARAGDHPFDLTTTLQFNTKFESFPTGERPAVPVADVKDIVVELPLGLAGDPLAAQRCTESELLVGGGTGCPPASRIGTVLFYNENGVHGTVSGTPAFDEVSALYNMVPEPGFPAQFAFTFFGFPAPIYATVVHAATGYVLRAEVPGVPKTTTEGTALTFFGDPNAANGEAGNPQALFTNPSDCAAGPLTTRVEADSWSAPGQWASGESVAYPGITGCSLLQFDPTAEMHPEVTEAEEPSGFEVKIKAPQNPNNFPLLATPDLKNVTMTLPEGMAVSPGAADGLVGCNATGPQGIDMPGDPSHPNEVVSEGEEIGPDGMSHLVAGHCPAASQIGTVEIATPLLEKRLQGRVYLAAPQCGGPGNECTAADATNGRLYGLYLEAEGSGVVIKLGGRVSVNPTTGQITARFTELPQQPVSEVSLRLKGGERAPLANPRQCGQAAAISDLTPWSSPQTPDALAPSSYLVDNAEGAEGACAATLPFAPSLDAGSLGSTAGSYSPLAVTLRRGAHMQDLSRLQVKLPPGLLGTLSSVALCGEPQAARGNCGAASEIGTTGVAVGTGPHPYVVAGKVYLTGPYNGAPFGLSVVVPAKAGPFDLGDVVVRAAIGVDEETGAITITSDSFPQILDGVPLRIQTVNVTANRHDFTFNPTNCARRQITASIESAQGAKAEVSSPFAVEGCNNLPFKPTFTVSTQAKTTKEKGASLHVVVTSALGQDNIGKVLASLPKQLPARLTTLQQACTEATFAQNPAQCPAASDVGFAKAVTPILNEPLAGPAYLVSHGGAAFPDLVLILEGDGVRLDLVGNTSIAKGITTSTFAAVPDAPVSSFELTLPQGPHSALTTDLPAKAKGSFCGSKLVMPTTLTAQSGRQLVQSTKITLLGCPKAVRHEPKNKRKKK